MKHETPHLKPYDPFTVHTDPTFFRLVRRDPRTGEELDESLIVMGFVSRETKAQIYVRFDAHTLAARVVDSPFDAVLILLKLQNLGFRIWGENAYLQLFFEDLLAAQPTEPVPEGAITFNL